MTAATALVAVALVAGCSTDEASRVPTREPATPASAPAVTAPPVGTVFGNGVAVSSTVVDPASHTLVVAATAPNRLLMFDTTDPARAPREYPLPAPAGQLSVADGQVLVPLPGRLELVDVSNGSRRLGRIDGDGRDATALPGGGFAVATSDGDVDVLDQYLAKQRTLTGLVSADSIVAVGNHLAVLDRKQTSITQFDADTGKNQGSLRVGDGATNLAVARNGAVLAADTAGNQLMVFGVDPLLERQQFPVTGAPYGIVYDDKAQLVWLTLTGTNEVVGYDITTGTPVEKQRFHTVRQPDSVAVDPATGDLYVASAAGDGIEQIPTKG
ncbi:hypothetical protein G4X40_13455 [Rhodococcus sp. D2-41]|uniref:YncE family protein n=1 Tax=Speluncibacter jeojiensis TaxID=2710754 RepID=UPI00240F545B|nr:hypothetical protein [Rhodococcus sp. D2-41]MDG3011158.1 hypothetical protein [Rhodococcus sp. D2-41]